MLLPFVAIHLFASMRFTFFTFEQSMYTSVGAARSVFNLFSFLFYREVNTVLLCKICSLIVKLFSFAFVCAIWFSSFFCFVCGNDELKRKTMFVPFFFTMFTMHTKSLLGLDSGRTYTKPEYQALHVKTHKTWGSRKEWNSAHIQWIFSRSITSKTLNEI